jgi:4'-phosphopantetheinyl transferase
MPAQCSVQMRSTVDVEVREFCNLTPDCVPELHRNVVHVWNQPLNVASANIQGYYLLLSEEERQRAISFRFEEHRNDFILTRASLRILIASYIGNEPQKVSFVYSHHGKPSLDAADDLRFNVSHTAGLALLAVAKGREVGVDVEKIRPQPDARKLSERFFSASERLSLAKLSSDELHAAFFRCWTRKEAYVKARGEGLSLPLHQFDVSIEAREGQLLLATRPDASETSRWMLRDLPTDPGYAAALAVAETVDG